VFTRSEVVLLTNKQTHKLTNKQTPLKTSNVLRYATTLCHNFVDVDNIDDLICRIPSKHYVIWLYATIVMAILLAKLQPDFAPFA